MIIVVGSGPSAVAATHALVKQGLEVTILDIGKQLEPDAQQAVTRMSALKPVNWSMDDLDRLDGADPENRKDLHLKRTYGSRYCFAGNDSPNEILWDGMAAFRHSDARGGLSNVWGAALLPYRQEDITDWPISLEDLESHYRAVLDFVPNTSVPDGLDAILPTYAQSSTPLRPSEQGAALLHDLDNARDHLQANSVHFGRSRLAIHANGDDSRPPCAHCGLCLAGCPYSLIYSADETLTALVAGGKVTYRSGQLVERIENRGTIVEVIGRDLEHDEEFRIPAERVFLAAGVLPTAKIVLTSLKRYDHPVELKDSQYFILPIFRFKKSGDVERQEMHTSAQVFVEVDDPSISHNLVHLQVYGFSSILLRELNRTFLRFFMRFRFLRRELLSRLMIIQGFLHSNDSGKIKLTLQKNENGGTRLIATSHAHHQAKRTAGKVAWKLGKLAGYLQAIPAIPALQLLLPGSSYHSGGSFPMASVPGDLETDNLGQLASLPYVHLVDSSVFPSIPATSITLSTMANAHRIATAVATSMRS